MAMDPDDVPTEITKLVYTAPWIMPRSQNDVAALLAHYWPAIEAHIREQVAREIETHDGKAPWGAFEGPVVLGAWIDSRDARQAARIARQGAGQ